MSNVIQMRLFFVEKTSKNVAITNKKFAKPHFLSIFAN